jgi:hypothetical protein
MLKPFATRQLIKPEAAATGAGVGVGSGPVEIGGILHGRILPAENTESTVSLVGFIRKFTTSPAQPRRLLVLVVPVVPVLPVPVVSVPVVSAPLLDPLPFPFAI